MPSYGEKQKSAGIELPCGCGKLGTRTMRSNNYTVMPTLRKIDNIEYKGNAVLNANK